MLKPADALATAATGAAMLFAATVAPPATAQVVSALPDQTSRIRLSNRDVNHVVCQGGDIEDVRFSAEKGIAVERGGADAWIKFLVLETDDLGAKTRTFVTVPAEFFVTCNGAVYPLYAEPGDMPAQTVMLMPGAAQRAAANEALVAPMVEEERAVSITLAVLQDRVPATFLAAAPDHRPIELAGLAGARLTERRRLEVEGAGLSVSEYLVTSPSEIPLAEHDFLDGALGTDIVAVTLDSAVAGPGHAARLVIIRRSNAR